MSLTAMASVPWPSAALPVAESDLKNMQIKNHGRYYAQGDSIALYFGTREMHSTMKRVIGK